MSTIFPTTTNGVSAAAFGLSGIAPSELSDSQRETLIKDYGMRFERAMANGDRDAAYLWLLAQNKQIANRSPAQVARLEECYFSKCGEADRAKLKGAQI